MTAGGDVSGVRVAERPHVAVVGPGTPTDEERALAFEVGALLAGPAPSSSAAGSAA